MVRGTPKYITARSFDRDLRSVELTRTKFRPFARRWRQSNVWPRYPRSRPDRSRGGGSARRRAGAGEREAEVVRQRWAQGARDQWGNKGVHALVDEDYQIETPPPASTQSRCKWRQGYGRRTEDIDTSSATRQPNVQAYSVPAAPASAWGPSGWSSASPTKDIIPLAAAAPPSTASPLPSEEASSRQSCCWEKPCARSAA